MKNFKRNRGGGDPLTRPKVEYTQTTNFLEQKQAEYKGNKSIPSRTTLPTS